MLSKNFLDVLNELMLRAARLGVEMDEARKELKHAQERDFEIRNSYEKARSRIDLLIAKELNPEREEGDTTKSAA